MVNNKYINFLIMLSVILGIGIYGNSDGLLRYVSLIYSCAVIGYKFGKIEE